MSASASGLALSIRTAEEPETFDLGGQNESTITNTIATAFAEPLPLQDMIRITFVTGAGKQARSKYDENAARAVTSTLRDLGYEEDRGASCIIECAGSFKSQHDTGKNLKTVVVFPKIVGANRGADNEDGEVTQSLIPEGCPAHKIAMSSMNTFDRMLFSQCPSWSQKKGCIAALEHLKHMVDEIDGKLMKGTPLEDAEQEFYDGVTGLDDKIASTKDAMHKQVETGGITKFEKETLLEHNAERLDTISSDMEGVAKGQKLEKLETMRAKAAQRKEMLEGIEPKPPHKLRHEQAIAKLWKEAVPLLQLEQKSKGRLLSVKETQAMARKDEIMEEIESLEEASRGWFEDVDAFDARVKAIRSNFTSKLNQQPKGKKSTGSKSSYASALSTGNSRATIQTNKWVLPGESIKKGAGAAGKKKKKIQGSGVFAAMMADDSDDENDGDDNNDQESENVQETQKKATNNAKNSSGSSTGNATPGNGNQQNENNAGTKKSGKKKNKKGKGKKKKESDMTEDELLAAGAAANAAKQLHDEERQVSHPAIDFLKSYIFPVILGIITWIVSFFFGKPKPKQKKN